MAIPGLDTICDFFVPLQTCWCSLSRQDSLVLVFPKCQAFITKLSTEALGRSLKHVFLSTLHADLPSNSLLSGSLLSNTQQDSWLFVAGKTSTERDSFVCSVPKEALGTNYNPKHSNCGYHIILRISKTTLDNVTLPFLKTIGDLEIWPLFLANQKTELKYYG